MFVVQRCARQNHLEHCTEALADCCADRLCIRRYSNFCALRLHRSKYSYRLEVWKYFPIQKFRPYYSIMVGITIFFKANVNDVMKGVECSILDSNLAIS